MPALNSSVRESKIPTLAPLVAERSAQRHRQFRPPTVAPSNTPQVANPASTAEPVEVLTLGTGSFRRRGVRRHARRLERRRPGRVMALRRYGAVLLEALMHSEAAARGALALAWLRLSLSDEHEGVRMTQPRRRQSLNGWPVAAHTLRGALS
jgi:hypothetical protein